MQQYSPKELLSKIEEAKNTLKSDPTFKEMCKEFKISKDIIDIIPVRFGEIDTSAKTIRGIIILNNRLLKDDNFKNNIHYLLHEIIHFCQAMNRPTQGAADGKYLDNEDEIEAFTYQIEFMDDEFGDMEADKYVEHLLDHHNIDDIKERKEKKEELSERCDD